MNSASGSGAVGVPLRHSPEKSSPQAVRTHYPGLDVAKFVASLFVICIHFNPLPGHAPHDVALDEVARFAVPFFFIASGYLFFSRMRERPKDQWRPAVNHMVRRLLGLLAFWWVFNLPDIWSHYIAGRGFWAGLSYYRSWVDRGAPWTTAWFFVALIIAMLAVTALRRRAVSPATIVLAALPLFAVGVIASQYLGHFPAGVQDQVSQFDGNVFSLQSGPLTGIFGVAVGSWLAERRRLVHDTPVAVWWAMLGVGAALGWWECRHWVQPGADGSTDQYVALLLVAPAVFLLSLRWSRHVPGAVFLRNASTVNFVAQFLVVWVLTQVLGYSGVGWQRAAFAAMGGLVLTAAIVRARRIQAPTLQRLLRYAC
jgi:serine/alanine racemase